MRNLILTIILILNLYNSNAQCPYDLIITNGPIYSMHEVDEDGLYIAGKFDSINNIACYGITKYSNGVFEILGEGLGPNADVRFVTSYNNLIIACGTQLLVNGANNCIAIWNGQHWYHPNISFNPGSILLGIAIKNEYIYFGGEFKLTGSSNTSHLLKYNIIADTISLIPTNLTTNSSTIRTLVFINDTLYVSGNLTNSITNLDVSVMYLANDLWHNIYIGGTMGHISRYNGNLVVSGVFSAQTGDTGNNIQYLHNGLWYTLNQGLNNGAGYLFNYDSKLFVTGAFTEADGKPARSIASWDGANWCSVNELVTEFLQFGIGVISFYKDTLFMTGAFNCGSGTTWWNLAKWKYPYFLNNCEPNSSQEQLDSDIKPDLRLYPNPTNNKLNIYLPHFYSNETFELIDVLGRVSSLSRNLVNNSVIEIDVSQLPIGVYLLNVTLYNGNKLSQRFIVSK